MPSTPRSSTPITSAAELGVWWAEVLSESDVEARRLSMMWLDDQGRMLARVLSLDGVPPLPHPTVVQAVLQIHGVFAERPDAAGCHLAFALSRPGDAAIVHEDRAWAGALGTAMQEHRAEAWSFHVAAGGWLTPVIEPPTARFDPRRVSIHSLQELLNRTWLRDQNNGHGNAIPGIGQGSFQPGDRRRRRHS
jgi:hypothetical protein